MKKTFFIFFLFARRHHLCCLMLALKLIDEKLNYLMMGEIDLFLKFIGSYY